jgi:hypothetical protein
LAAEAAPSVLVLVLGVYLAILLVIYGIVILRECQYGLAWPFLPLMNPMRYQRAPA